MAHSLLDYYKAIDNASQKMLEAAQTENWDQVVRLEGQGHPVAQPQRLVALKQAAVHQQALALELHQELGAGHGAGAAQKGDVHAHSSLLLGPLCPRAGRRLQGVCPGRGRPGAVRIKVAWPGHGGFSVP